MVGAGFSQNADKARPNVNRLPTWHELTTQICHQLYLPEDGTRLRDALAEASATSGFLRLAQEYKAVFGDTALHDLIGSLIRDGDYNPGSMHKRLLSLPWRDVFSTNWDTLLERTRDSVTDRPYSVVRTAVDIASSTPPRIIKLHGSFPSYYPLIVTEEDYRTYPREFAPFVNTVQQAMMETVLLLIGFSGDDPNFLHWSGWVRDNMGPSAPIIYLAGWLDLSSHRRQVLVDRNVVAIDLARHPKAPTWPDGLRHQYATEWILRTLELGAPYDTADWPKPSHREDVSVKEILAPLDIPTIDEPEVEPLPKPSVKGAESDELRDIVGVWRHNRRLYPGWLALPRAAFRSVSHNLELWEQPALDATGKLRSPAEALIALREVVWRHEILLVPLSPLLEDRASRALDSIDWQNRKIVGIDGETDVDWTELREAWREVALALVTLARQRFDQESFECRIKGLAPFIDDDDTVHQRICHERVLWALWELDLSAVTKLVDGWDTDDSDPLWTMRKAAVLVEIHRPTEARVLMERALKELRSHRAYEGSLGSPSREGWALLVAEAFERKLGERSKVRYDRRLTELAQFHCDSREELKFRARRITERVERRDAPEFDHGLQTLRFGFSVGANQRFVAAWSAVRLTEVAALPPSANRVTIGRDILTDAADGLANTEPRLASTLVLRICDYDGEPLLKRVLSRSRVAAMSCESIEAISESCNRIIDYATSRLSGDTVERLRVAIEVLSRVSLRLRIDQVEKTFNDALALYQSEPLASHLWLAPPIGNLLARTWTSLPTTLRSDRVLDLLVSPIAGSVGFIPNAAGHPLLDPGELLSHEQPPPRTTENEERWTRLVALLVDCLRSGGDARRRASNRIRYPGLKERLTESEKTRIADALWDPNHTPKGSLPRSTGLDDWEFLFLLEPAPNLADERFRKKWIHSDNLTATRQSDKELGRTVVVPLSGKTVGTPTDPASIFVQVGSAIAQSRLRADGFHLSDQEQQILGELVERWCDTVLPASIPGLDPITIRPIRTAVIGLCEILPELQLSSGRAAKLFDKLTNLHNMKVPAYELIPGIVRLLPDRFDGLSQVMRVGIVSEDVEVNRSAVSGMAEWMESAKRLSDLCPPPADLVQEVGLTIATRRSSVLEMALRLATWVFREGDSSQKNSIRSLALHGLHYLTEELRYDRDEYNVEEDDLPKLRWRSAQLAVAMEADGLVDMHTVKEWLTMIKNDPLPEVRYAQP